MGEAKNIYFTCLNFRLKKIKKNLIFLKILRGSSQANQNVCRSVLDDRSQHLFPYGEGTSLKIEDVYERPSFADWHSQHDQQRSHRPKSRWHSGCRGQQRRCRGDEEDEAERQ